MAGLSADHCLSLVNYLSLEVLHVIYTVTKIFLFVAGLGMTCTLLSQRT